MLPRRFASLLIPFIALVCLSSCAPATMEGDILINGSGSPQEMLVDDAPNISVEELRGCVQQNYQQCGVAKTQAAVIIVPPKNVLPGGGSGSYWPQAWIYRGEVDMREQLHPPKDYISSRKHKIEFVLDGRKRTLKIQGKLFALGDGKYFVVVYDKNWKPKITQLENDLETAPLPDKTLQFLRKIFLKGKKELPHKTKKAPTANFI